MGLVLFGVGSEGMGYGIGVGWLGLGAWYLYLYLYLKYGCGYGDVWRCMVRKGQRGGKEYLDSDVM